MFQLFVAVIIFCILKWIIKLIFGSAPLPRNVQNQNYSVIRKKTEPNKNKPLKAFPVKPVPIKAAPVKVALLDIPPANIAQVKTTPVSTVPVNTVPVSALVKVVPINATPVKIEPIKKESPAVTKLTLKHESSLDFHWEESRRREIKKDKLITKSRSLEPTSISTHDEAVYCEVEKLRVMSAEKRAEERNARHFAQLKIERRLKLKN